MVARSTEVDSPKHPSKRGVDNDVSNSVVHSIISTTAPINPDVSSQRKKPKFCFAPKVLHVLIV